MEDKINSNIPSKDKGMDNKDLGIICATIITLGTLVVSYLVGKLDSEVVLKWGLGSVTLIAVGKSMLGITSKK